MRYPLHVAFLWHMHQPYYRDPASGDFALPWTRLHATKDYLHMAQVLADFPQVHVTVNFVPSLLRQLDEYARGQAMDQALRVSQKEQLSDDDKEYLLSFFFNANWQRIISRYEPYRELLHQRQQAQGDWRRFPDQYWTDLIVWFHLAWFDPSHVQRDAELRALVAKGRNFHRDDIRTVLEKGRAVAAATPAVYRTLAERGQIELTTSPYFHPILPLLVDSSSAREATPDISLPAVLFAHPEDAIEQVRRGILAHQRVFGRTPQGLWPPEGAVSQAVADVLGQHTDLLWIASDEAILARSLGRSICRDEYGHVTDPALLYQPYALRTQRRAGPPLTIIFRDRVLSDRIGFVYQHMDSRAAAHDLVERLHHIAARLGDSDQPHLVSIILDGENCWEYYENNGDDFLRCLYGLLSSDSTLKTVTVSEYLRSFPPQATIERLAAGSWIGGDLLTWIGEPAQNEAWQLLGQVRKRMTGQAAHNRSVSLAVIEQAWDELYIAEGSDWFWWYSPRNDPQSDVFDAEFRGHLAEACRILGMPVPQWLTTPIRTERTPRGRTPSGYVAPVLTANSQPGHAWSNAGYLDPTLSTATMQRTSTLLKRLYYGYNPQSLLLRLELAADCPVDTVALYLATPRLRPNRHAPLLDGSHSDGDSATGWTHELVVKLSEHTVMLRQSEGHEIWRPVNDQVEAAVSGNVAEIRLPLQTLGLELGDTVELVAALGRNGAIEERHPLSHAFGFRLLRINDHGKE